MLLLERDPAAGRPLLGDLIGWRKRIVGDRDWRIVWRVTTDAVGNQVIDVAEVWAVDARADAEVYAEMNDRIAALGDSPITQALSEVIQRLGRAKAASWRQPSRSMIRFHPGWSTDSCTRLA